MLPIPKDPKFKTPEVSEDEFNNPDGIEDESLLKTGAWKGDGDDVPSLIENVQNEIDGIKTVLKGAKPTK
jgi:hypothetical protein